MGSVIPKFIETYQQRFLHIEGSSRKTLLRHHSTIKVECVQKMESGLSSSGMSKDEVTAMLIKLDAKLNYAFDEILTARNTQRTQAASSDGLPEPGPSVRPIAIQTNSINGDNHGTHQNVPGTKIYFEDDPIRGNMSFVYKGYVLDTANNKCPAAVKRYTKDSIKFYKKELEIWSEIHRSGNPNSVFVARLLDSTNIATDQFFFLAIELADMDLQERIEQLKITPIPDDSLLSFMGQVSKGLSCLHSHDIVHRDIKPQNILVFLRNNVVKLTDFGISRKVVAPGESTQSEGSDNWMAPEALRAKINHDTIRSDKAHDIFALGLVFHFILSLGEHPFAKRDTVIASNIVDLSIQPAQLSHPHYTEKNLIASMLNKDPSQRPGISAVLNHPAFWELDRSIGFLIKFINILYHKKEEQVKQTRRQVDTLYQGYYNTLVSSGQKAFNWRELIGETVWGAVHLRKNSNSQGNAIQVSLPKTYDNTSLTGLLEMVRDKVSHNTELVDALLTDEYFGENGLFKEHKLYAYFHTHFPDVFIFVVQNLKQFQCMYSELQRLDDPL